MAKQPLGRHDRHLRLASKFTGQDAAQEQVKFLSSRVLVTGDESYIRTNAGRLCLITAINLIARFCNKVDLALGTDQDLFEELSGLLHCIDRSLEVNTCKGSQETWKCYDAVLFVGFTEASEHPITSVVGKGWLASVSSHGPTPRILDGAYNPFGPLFAALLGVAEVFKRLLRPLPGKLYLLEPTVFSVYSYETYQPNGAIDPGPPLPDELALPNFLLAGAGAVGNAFAYALREVEGASGRFAVVDREDLDDDSNLNRYLLAFEADVNAVQPVRKVDLVARAVEGTKIHCNPFKGEVRDYLAHVFSGVEPRPSIVISAVDNNEVRPTLQRLWPDLLIEGATGDSTAQVSRHAHEEGLACLMCIHTVDVIHESRTPYETRMAQYSGLTEQRVQEALRDSELVITQADIASAPKEKHSFLEERLDKPICSVLSELENLSAQPQEVPRAATVSFVSMAAGTLAAAELIKWAGGIGTKLETLFQIDMFFPLENAALQAVDRGVRCECHNRRQQIEEYREMVRRIESRNNMNQGGV